MNITANHKRIAAAVVGVIIVLGLFLYYSKAEATPEIEHRMIEWGDKCETVANSCGSCHGAGAPTKENLNEAGKLWKDGKLTEGFGCSNVDVDLVLKANEKAHEDEHKGSMKGDKKLFETWKKWQKRIEEAN